jgi:hypothetical protein
MRNVMGRAAFFRSMETAFAFWRFLLVTGFAIIALCDVSSSAADFGELKQRQITFLNRIRAADPQHQTIDRAIFNEQNELGLILDGSLEMEKIPTIMRTILTQMAQEFPNLDLTIIAYAPTNPPLTVGTAHLDARTRDMTVHPGKIITNT